MSGRGRILVTGGAGFVGSHACKLLRSTGFEPVTYDNMLRGNASSVRYGPLIRGDLLDAASLRAAIKTTQPIACLHFAAFAYVAESVQKPALYYKNNVTGSLALLEALAQAGVDKIVFSSTCAVYGQADVMPIAEHSPKRPLSPYGRSKLMVEEMLMDFDQAYGLRSIILRYFNAAGADPDGEIGEMHDPEPHLIPRALMAAAGVIPDLQVLGVDYPTSDGTAIRDYMHVADLAQAHVAALEYLLDRCSSDAFNLGIGRGYSVSEIISAVERVTNRPVPTVTGPRRIGDPAEVVADPRYAQEALAFQPAYPDIDDMVRSAWSWFRENGFRGLQ